MQSHDNAWPNISVVMCTYNGGLFLKEQLESLLRQTLLPTEIIIQDDGSTDATPSIAREYAERYECVRFFKHEGQPGINRNFFSAMKRASGDLIAICDQDDVWELDKLEKQVAALGDKLLVGGMSRPFATDGTAVSFDSRVPNIDLLRMMYVGMMPGHTQLFRRELLDKLPDNTFFMYDLQTQAYAAAAESVAYVPEVIVNQRRHLNAATYNAPTDRSHSLANIIRSSWESLRIYRTLRPNIRNRFAQWEDFLLKTKLKNVVVRDALTMARLQQSRTFWGWLRLTRFCILHRHQLFHVTEKNRILAIFRAAFFPISCATYYKYLLKDAKFKGTAP